MKGLTLSLLLGLAAIVALAFAPEWVWTVVTVSGLVLIGSLTVGMVVGRVLAGPRANPSENAQERAARKRIYGDVGWWR